jgi:single-strand selective monofunctional uracil DNA glycosylase
VEHFSSVKKRSGDSAISDALVEAAAALRKSISRLSFAEPVTHVYNPLVYAWAPHEAYLRRYFTTPKRIVFLGMNPGPFGMAQTGVPFGEIAAVRDWLKISAPVAKPRDEHPRRPITGFDTTRSEVSGQRLWGLFANRFGEADRFFAEHAVMNYCPLAFLESSGRNRTPDKLSPSERALLYDACNAHLRAMVSALQPEWLIGIGDFAMKRAEEALPKGSVKIGRILHPSPASPAANRDWAGAATLQLRNLGIWR